MTRPEASETCRALHVAPLQRDYERLTWQEATPRADRIRVREHTCSCRNISYELCQAGGLVFVRRIYRSDSVVVHETDWLQVGDAERLWMRILLGQAY
ncbi:hypothetical protein Misp01_52180 [Microtetraspora sp. NBRC 13810]|uniref:hypothetical protein n=1 Tax=Microtetraspora sp. NBRC 13810 TaxID=3030990 RepID=UPI0025540F5D|nr:hypothetical protein [Microtetraspora sp. NBRC 13810]GLW10089.1 hypothetical protein Misp01_52180 [Microtetraspora sp. NBRC 13810]